MKKTKVVKNIPNHLGIILDGNRRWAKERKLSSFEGHRHGLNNIKTIVEHAFKEGIQVVTVFAFSTENWHREKKEVDYLMKLFKLFLQKEVVALVKKGVKIKFFGRLSDFSAGMFKEMKKIEKITKNGINGQFNICLSYGGRDEIIRAVNKLIKDKKQVITEEMISNNLDSQGLADPDLIIRTSGEKRLSGFLTWQTVYSELYFTNKYWPAFTKADLELALKEYSQRKRRFGAN